MNYKYIVNPLTNRKCNIYSPNGQNIINQYLNQEGGACSLCGAEGVTKTTCPKNPAAKNPKPEKHKPSVVERETKCVDVLPCNLKHCQCLHCK